MQSSVTLDDFLNLEISLLAFKYIDLNMLKKNMLLKLYKNSYVKLVLALVM